MPFRRCFLTFSCAAILTFALLLPVSAHAAMVFCNRAQGPVEAALGYRESSAWITEGWWRIEPGQCARVFGQPLTQRFYFYYAVSLVPSGVGKSPFIWSGKYMLCTDSKAFKIEGDDNCESRGYITKGFHDIDIGVNTRDYTLDFKDGRDSK